MGAGVEAAGLRIRLGSGVRAGGSGPRAGFRWLRRRAGSGEGLVVNVEDDVAGSVLGSDWGFQLAHLAEGFKSSLHEIGEGAGLAVVDGVMSEGFGDGIEVVEYGCVVIHVDKAYERNGVGDDWGAGLEKSEAAATVVIEAEIAAGKGGHGATGAAEAEMAAAGEIRRLEGAGFVRFHFEVPLRVGVKEKAQPRLGSIRFLVSRVRGLGNYSANGVEFFCTRTVAG